MSKMNRKKYISINAEMFGRAYKIAKRAESSYQNGGIFIWSSGQGLNIVGTDRQSLIFFHDENLVETPLNSLLKIFARFFFEKQKIN